MALLKHTDFEEATERFGVKPLPNTAVWLKVGITLGSPIPNYAVAQFTENEILVFEVSPMGKVVMPPFAVLPIESDDDIQIRRKFSGHKVEGPGWSFVIRNGIIGASWHKPNLTNVLKRFGVTA